MKQKRRDWTQVPKVGQDIYVRGAMYMSRGSDDYNGGLAKVTQVKVGISAGKPAYFVSVEEVPGHAWNWTFLGQEQAELRKQHGKRRAGPDPDDRPEFNRWD